MSKRDVADLACRILALYLLIVNVEAIVLMPLQFGLGLWELVTQGQFAQIAFGGMCMAVPVAMLLAMIWFIWSRSYWIATKLVPDDANYGRWPHIRVGDLQTAAFSVVGLVAFLTSVRFLSQSVGHYIDASRRPASNMGFMDWLGMEGTLAALANGALGLWLLLGSRGIVQMLRRLRRTSADRGQDEPLNEPSEPVAARSEP